MDHSVCSSEEKRVSHVKSTEGVSLWLVEQKLPEEKFSIEDKVRY